MVRFSARGKISCGGFHGTILGLLFFLLYVNGININVSTVLDLTLFADDTCVFMSRKNLHCLAHRLNSEMSKLSIWFRENKFPLNLKKMYILFRPSKIKDVQIVI